MEWYLLFAFIFVLQIRSYRYLKRIQRADEVQFAKARAQSRRDFALLEQYVTRANAEDRCSAG